MEQYEIGKLVKSKVGHDAGDIYIIIKIEDAFVYLVNGENRKLCKPKKKKMKHVQPINRVYDVTVADDVAIKRILKLYKKEA